MQGVLEMKKTSTLPPLRVEPQLRRAIERSLKKGETLTSFVEDAVRRSLERRESQRAFIARGLASEERAEANGRHVSAGSVLTRLQRRLDKARSATREGARR
jgi:predicted transcriptional regulator